MAAVGPGGALVYVPPGTYLLSRYLTLRPRTYFKGAGLASLFTRAEGGTDTIFYSTRRVDEQGNELEPPVDDVTVEAIAIDMNGAQSEAWQEYSYRHDVLGIENPLLRFVNGMIFRTNDKDILAKDLRVRDVRVFDSTGQNNCCGHGILVKEYQNAWIERNHLSDGLRLAAGGIGDKLIVENNLIEDGNDNALTISVATPNSLTANYRIIGNIVKAPHATAIYIGDDWDSNRTGEPPEGIVVQSIVVEGNQILGPVQPSTVMLIVKLAGLTERVHIVNNILVQDGQQPVAGIEITNQSGVTRLGRDILIANNTVQGPFEYAGIWVQSAQHVRVAHNQVTGNTTSSGILVTHGSDTVTVQGNIVSDCRSGLGVEDSTNVQVIGNSFAGVVRDGMTFVAAEGRRLSAQVIGNRSADNGGAGVVEAGAGTLDTHYFINDLRGNVSGAFVRVNAQATQLSNLG